MMHVMGFECRDTYCKATHLIKACQLSQVQMSPLRKHERIRVNQSDWSYTFAWHLFLVSHCDGQTSFEWLWSFYLLPVPAQIAPARTADFCLKPSHPASSTLEGQHIYMKNGFPSHGTELYGRRHVHAFLGCVRWMANLLSCRQSRSLMTIRRQGPPTPEHFEEPKQRC